MKILLNEVTLNYQYKIKPSGLPKILSSKEAYEYFRKVWDKPEYIESAYLLLLNRGNKVLGFIKISSGSVSGTVVSPSMIFQAILKSNASGFILAHNHPSGNLKPSDTDIGITKKLREAAKLFEISFCDHLIITPEGYLSFADEGLM